MKKLLISHSAKEVNSYRHRTSVNRIASNEQPRDRSSRLLALRCLLVAAGCSLLVGLVGCGPAASDNATSLESRASVSGPPLSKQGPSPRNDPFTSVTPAASPVPLASGIETAAAAGRGTVPGGDSPYAVPVPSTRPADGLDPRVVPAWMAKELDSLDVGTRPYTLETWAQSALPGAIDR